MTVIDTNPTSLSPQQLGLLMQYTVEAYKTFEKLGESLPNPMAAAMFANFAVEERLHRDLIEAKIATSSVARIKVTLGPDLLFQDILEGDLSYREMTEFLIARERTMHRRLEESRKSAPENDRYILIYLAAAKRSHIVELERELELIRLDPDWFRREDAEFRISNGPRPE
jgi:rubrerythrin